MLLYHLTSRDELVLQAFQEARRRQREIFGELLAPRPGVPYATVLTERRDLLTAGPDPAWASRPVELQASLPERRATRPGQFVNGVAYENVLQPGYDRVVKPIYSHVLEPVETTIGDGAAMVAHEIHDVAPLSSP